MGRYLRVRDVDDAGISLVALRDRPVDVCVEGHRVWTFWSRRDTVATPSALVDRRPVSGRWPLRRAPWPKSLRRHLNGRGRITVRDSACGAVFFDGEVVLGDGEGPIRVRNKRGIDLAIDKSGRLVPTFSGRSQDNITSLIDATEAVIEALESVGLEPFIAYGTLLGAVREGAVLGHDSDADIGYVSRHTNPVDVARESFDVQRRLADRGWRISRYSGASFKIHVTEGEVTRGLDVFGGFLASGRLYLMGEIGVDFDSDWIRPRTTAMLEGRPMPVPARPEKLLEVTYGPGWRVPDPAFQFTTSQRTIRAFNDWFRGLQPGIRYWHRHAHHGANKPPSTRPSGQARKAARLSRTLGAEVLDIGAGHGSDSLWLARQGIAVTAYDYVPRGLEMASDYAEKESLDLSVRYLNLAEWRSVFAEGARLARVGRPRVILANHVVDATSARGRESLARLCSMALRECGGRLLAQFYVDPDSSARRGDWMVGHPDAEAFTTLLEGAGASRVEVKMMPGHGRPKARVEGVWTPCS